MKQDSPGVILKKRDAVRTTAKGFRYRVPSIVFPHQFWALDLSTSC
jgi:hypothetical protein